MPNVRLVGSAIAVFAVLIVPRPLHAQIYETVGTRAQGMGGAFVAVADDATATWWNPAGLATGASFNAVFERSRTTDPADQVETRPAWRAEETSFSMSFPALGLSYYRVRVNELRPVSAPAGDPPGQAGVSLIRSLAISQYGATVGRSLGGVVIGSTLRLLRSGETSILGASGTDLLETAADSDVPVEQRLTSTLVRWRRAGTCAWGISAKHVREPEFGDDVSRFKLLRQIRTGGAVMEVLPDHSIRSWPQLTST